MGCGVKLMNQALKLKLILFISMMGFLILYMVVFGSKNAAIGITMVMAAFMGLSNDLSFKPKTSFLKVWGLLLILGVASFFNYPLTIWSCVITFIIVFATTFTSYHSFSTSLYIPFLMCYFMMVGNPVSLEDFPMRILSLTFGAIFIVGLNIVVNRKKDYKLSVQTIDKLVGELDNAIDLKLEGKKVSLDSFKTVNGFYLALFNKFEYKYFPTNDQQAVLNIVKAFQSIGVIISKYNLSNKELNYIKSVLSNIFEIDFEDIFDGIVVDTKEMYRVLLNLEIIVNEIKNKEVPDNRLLPSRKIISESFKPIIKNQFSFRSAKFTFSFKMAFMMTVWELLTLIFNLSFTKWLYFITIPLMMPYIDDLAYMAKARIKGTFVGAFIFAIILVVMHYIQIPAKTLTIVVMFVCMLIMVFKLKDKFILTIASTIMSIMAALSYIEPPKAIWLKILWVVVGVCVVSLFNFKFLPYSVEKETKNNLKTCFKLNGDFIELVRQKCMGDNVDAKTALLAVDNIVHENIEVTDDNRQLYELQISISDTCNFILNYLNLYGVSGSLKDNMLNIIDDDAPVDDNLEIKDRVIAYSMRYVMNSYKMEIELS